MSSPIQTLSYLPCIAYLLSTISCDNAQKASSSSIKYISRSAAIWDIPESRVNKILFKQAMFHFQSSLNLSFCPAVFILILTVFDITPGNIVFFNIFSKSEMIIGESIGGMNVFILSVVNAIN